MLKRASTLSKEKQPFGDVCPCLPVHHAWKGKQESYNSLKYPEL